MRPTSSTGFPRATDHARPRPPAGAVLPPAPAGAAERRAAAPEVEAAGEGRAARLRLPAGGHPGAGAGRGPAGRVGGLPEALRGAGRAGGRPERAVDKAGRGRPPRRRPEGTPNVNKDTKHALGACRGALQALESILRRDRPPLSPEIGRAHV